MGYKKHRVTLIVAGNGLGNNKQFVELAERLFRVDHEDLEVAYQTPDQAKASFSLPAHATMPAVEYAEAACRRTLAALSECRIDASVSTRVEDGRLCCDMQEGCTQRVTNIDIKGFVYCAPHGEARKAYCRCRKLKPAELRKLERGESILYSKATAADVPFERYATADFMRAVAAAKENGTLNMYVDEAINKKVSSTELEKEIKVAIKMHSKYNEQSGSSILHGAVVAAMWNLLAALRQAVANAVV